LYFQLIAEAGAARATVITYVNPAVAVGLGVVVLGEPFTPLIVISFALILAGSVLATRPAAHRSAQHPPTRMRKLRGQSAASPDTGLPESARAPR
jgi:membrane protein implicated in regulation of membrane protease activity